MKGQFAVIGLGRFGYHMAKTLAESGSEVIAIDREEERVKLVSDFVTYAVQLDAMDEKALRSVGVQNVETAIVSIGENIEASILVVMILKEIGVKNIIAKAVTPLHGRVLEHIAVKRVIYPERDMAVRIAHSLTRPKILEELELSQNYSIVELSPPKGFIGKSAKEVQMRSKYGVNLIAIKRKVIDKGIPREVWNINPLPTDVIEEGDVLVLIGSNEDLGRLAE
jgi:trk system potassium uptake protein TrkA